MTRITAPLGAGSYDYDALKEATEAVATGEHESPVAAENAMRAAVETADQSKGREVDARDTPGYSWDTRARKIGDATVKERIQVADGEQEAAAAGQKKPRGSKGATTSSTGEGAADADPSVTKE